jgi:hypothetical protein
MMAYFHVLAMLDLVYYDWQNRINPNFVPYQYSTIASLSNTLAYDLTGYDKDQLCLVYLHWRIPDTFQVPWKYTLNRENYFIYWLCYLQSSNTYMAMTHDFGDNPLQMSSMIICIQHSSIRSWVIQWRCGWTKLMNFEGLFMTSLLEETGTWLQDGLSPDGAFLVLSTTKG